ncbi:MAG: plasmid pRiA4b ORF-3 family protein [Herpetosiphonaceae bacterium]|nr:plasmid pRiA4b ORF-3 family protein [Herpetosiphonaceae bacterium]
MRPRRPSGAQRAPGLLRATRDVSPLIWRRLLIRGDTTLATLHTILQTAFAWEDEHLYEFRIYGRTFGSGANASSSRTHQLAAFHLRRNERVQYTYNFYANWVHELRIEAIRPVDPHQIYPWCCGGARAAPTEECRDAWTFMALRQHYPLLRVADELITLLRQGTTASRSWDDDDTLEGTMGGDGDEDGDADDKDDGCDPETRFETLRYWLLVDRFDRRTLNRSLGTIACPQSG